MGEASRHTCASTFPPERFYCLLDELPLQLIPARAPRSKPPARNPQKVADEARLYLNPHCRLRPAEEIPDELKGSEDLLAALARQGTIAWVPNSTGDLLPFWLGPQLERIVVSLQRNEIVAHSIPPHTRQTLHAAGILISDRSTQLQDQDRAASIATAATSFRHKGYAPIASLIHPFHVAALRRYYRYAIRTGAIPLGDRQSPRRYAAHNEPIACFFHHALTKTFSEIAGQPLKPSYVYMASYLSGAELRKHKDRAQCEFSITLCLDFSPEPELATPWPISLDTPNGTVTVYQALGDGLAYRGTRLTHYRGTLPEGQTSTSIFFHYVSADFEGPLG